MRLGGPDGWDEDGGAREQATLRGGATPRPGAEPPLVLAFSFSPSSTALALYRGPAPVRAGTVLHELGTTHGRRSEAQRDARAAAVRSFLRDAGVHAGALAAIAVHADTQLSLECGTYRIDAALLRAVDGSCENLAACVAHDLAAEWTCPALAVDPAGTQERELWHRVENGSGERSMFAMKAAARRHALAVDRPLESLRMVLVHLGGAISVCVQAGARVGEVNDALDARGAAELAEALDRAEAGDPRAAAVVHGAGNRIAQVVGGLATVLEGEVDAVLVTGALQRAAPVLAEICRRVEWIAPVFLYRDEDELQALVHGALAVLRGDEPLKKYA